MINLKITKSEQKKREKKMMEIAPYQNDYPWGSVLRFEDETIQKSEFLKTAKAGAEVDIKAKGKIVEVRTTDREKGKEYECVEIQIQRIDFNYPNEAEDAFNEE